MERRRAEANFHSICRTMEEEGKKRAAAGFERRRNITDKYAQRPANCLSNHCRGKKLPPPSLPRLPRAASTLQSMQWSGEKYSLAKTHLHLLSWLPARFVIPLWPMDGDGGRGRRARSPSCATKRLIGRNIFGKAQVEPKKKRG